MPGNIVTYAHRPKRPPRKRKMAIAAPVVVRGEIDAVPPPPAKDHPTPANNDRKPPSPCARQPAIVTSTSRKRAKLERAADRAAEPDNDPKATARVRAFLDRMIRPRG
jgi:hypothetical protein